MDLADRYRQYARDCLQFASAAETEDQKKQFLSMACEWTHAAQRVDGMFQIDEDKPSPPPPKA